MQMYFKSRESARSVKSGKIFDNGKESSKRWGRAVDAKHSQKEAMTLKYIKDYRNIESAKVVQVLKVKKLKEMVK